MGFARVNYLARQIKQVELLGNAGLWHQRVTSAGLTAGYIEDILGQPPNCNEIAFIEYILTAGQIRLSQCPRLPNEEENYFFSSSGSDGNDGLSPAFPKQTTGAMNTLIDAANTGGYGLTINCIRGSQWYTSTADPIIDIVNTNKNIAIVAASTPATMLFQRPIFNHFSEAFTSGWSLVSGSTYEKTDAGTQICAVYVEDSNQFSYNPRNPAGTWGPFRPIKRCASTVEVDAFPVGAESGCFFHDGSKIYIKLAGATDPGTVTIRVLRNNSDTCFQVDAEGFRADELLTFGHGMNMSDTANQKSGFQFALDESAVACLVRCGSYYNSSHNIGMVDGTGGCTYLHQCDVGFPNFNGVPGETQINAFATNGGQEAITVDCDSTYGTYPSTQWYNASSKYRAQPFFGHTVSNTCRFMGHLAPTMQPGPFQCGTNSKATTNNLPQTDTHVGGAKAGTGWLQAKHFVIMEYYKLPLAGYRSMQAWYHGNGSRSVYCNNQYRIAHDDAALAFYNSAESQDSIFFNNVVEIDMGLAPGTRSTYSLVNPPATNATFGWYAHNFYVLHNWNASGSNGFRFPNYDLESSLNTQSFVNNVVVRSDDCTDPLEVRLGGSTSVDGRDNNAWYGGANITGQDDAAPILLDTEIDSDYKPQPGDKLWRAAKTLTVPLLYNHAFKPREAVGAHVGHW